MRNAAYRIKQGEMIVARVEGRDEWHLINEIVHYAQQYIIEGSLQIQVRDRETGRWRVYDNWGKRNA